MKFSTDWDINYYKTDYESEEHWELRKKFMEVHKDKYPEDELVCLAQCFTNIEFMGCRYPEGTMQLVADLSNDVAAEFREERAKRLKRTFVKASDAAEQRAKGSKRFENLKDINTFSISAELKATKLTDYNSDSDDDNANYFRPCFSGAKPIQKKSNNIGFPVSNNYWKPLDKKKSKQREIEIFDFFNKTQKFLNSTKDYTINKGNTIDLFTGPLMFGRFILYDYINDRNCLTASSKKCNVEIKEREILLIDEKKVEVYVGGVLAGSSIDLTMKEAKSKAYDAALKKLKQECYVVKPNPNPDRIHITKNNETIVANLHKSSPDLDMKINENNIGYKMMLKQGWTGGGLGTQTQGRQYPIDFLVKNNRKGFGNDSDDVNASYFRTLLTNYIKSEDIRDLYFEAGFTKEERATLHQIASSKKLKSSSHGREPNRHLVISKKNITLFRILDEVLINKNPVYMNKYEVKVPRCKFADFPNHTKFKPV